MSKEREEMCANCRFYDQHDGQDFGFCRRYAPRIAPGDSGANNAIYTISATKEDFINALKYNANWARWPATTDHSWCGEFRGKGEE